MLNFEITQFEQPPFITDDLLEAIPKLLSRSTLEARVIGERLESIRVEERSLQVDTKDLSITYYPDPDDMPLIRRQFSVLPEHRAFRVSRG